MTPYFPLAILAALLAGVLRTSVGVGAGIAFTASLLLIFDAKMTLAITAFLQIALGVSAVVHYWGKWDTRLTVRLLLAAVVGMMLGSWLVTELPGEWVRRVMGVGLASVAALELLRKEGAALLADPQPRGELITGFFSGIAGSMVNAAGAVLAVGLRRKQLSYETLIGTLSAVVLAHDLLRLAVYANFGLLNQNAFTTALALLPFVLAGGWIGTRARHLVSEKLLVRTMLGLVAFVGIALLI